MFQIKHRYTIWTLRREQNRLRRNYDHRLAALRADKSKTSNDYNTLQADDYYANEDIREAMEYAQSRILLERASRYDVELPQGREFWSHSDDGLRPFLNLAGRESLRQIIAKAKDEKWSDFERYAKSLVPIIGALAALFGAATGVILALKKK